MRETPYRMTGARAQAEDEYRPGLLPEHGRLMSEAESRYWIERLLDAAVEQADKSDNLRDNA